ncbi:uncharacterized protein LOC106639989 [Copidosoma floridanum]|uniref:uncharacterized protein LOC106639989 n=1 Tax=Copidosoma floridanum TaxID=29053 RepID=UPI0006C990F3|nr:uncharacterized protein LOC106639989 [Copidosoma floridanum]
MTHRGSDIHDVNAEQAEIMKWRAERRLVLRNQYLKEIHNPNSGPDGHIFDEQIFRQYATIMGKDSLYKPKPNHFLKIAAGILAFYAVFKLIRNDRDRKEHLYRTGQISYRDREFKFA